ncbi:MAG TPA: hypothetical protein VID94_09195, partial [Acidimicrobiales bacterium]
GEIVAADVVARHLTTPPELVENPDIAPGTVAVATGLDFTTVQRTPRPAGATPPQVDRVVAAGDLVTNGVVVDPDAQVDVADGSEGVPITAAIGRTAGEAPPEITCR